MFFIKLNYLIEFFSLDYSFAKENALDLSEILKVVKSFLEKEIMNTLESNIIQEITIRNNFLDINFTDQISLLILNSIIEGAYDYSFYESHFLKYNTKNIPKQTFLAKKISQIKPFWHKKYHKSNFFGTKNLKFYFGLFLS